MGSNEFEHDWKGSKWQFVSAENRKLFKRNPEKYAPRYGGYCAWAAAQGYTAEGDPEVWRIVDGKLYLNFNRAVQEKWFKDIPGLLSNQPQYTFKGGTSWNIYTAPQGQTVMILWPITQKANR
jgi:hypothetical protein